MPELKNESPTNAESILKALDMGLNVTVLEETSEEVEKGKVIRTEPEAGAKLKKNDTVRVYVSTGDGKAEVPNVLGKSENEAKQLLEAAGFKATVNRIYDGSVHAGEVISQSAKPEDRVAEGTSITIDVSKGPEPTEPPTETTQAPDEPSETETQAAEPSENSEDAEDQEP